MCCFRSTALLYCQCGMALNENLITRLNGALTSVNVSSSRYRLLAKASVDLGGRLQISRPATCLGLACVSAIKNPRSSNDSLLMVPRSCFAMGGAILRHLSSFTRGSWVVLSARPAHRHRQT